MQISLTPPLQVKAAFPQPARVLPQAVKSLGEGPDLGRLSPEAQGLIKAGQLLAELGPLPAGLLGIGLGLAASASGLGTFGPLAGPLVLPLIGGTTLALEALRAQQGQRALEGGFQSIEQAIVLGRPFTPAPAGRTALVVAAGAAELVLSGALFGSLAPLVAVPAILGTAWVANQVHQEAQSQVLTQLLQARCPR